MVPAAASWPVSKWRAAAVMITVPDLTPTPRPAATVATAESLLDHTNATLGIGCESPGPRISQALAATTVSLPRNRIRTGGGVTCTHPSGSGGGNQGATGPQPIRSPPAPTPPPCPV